MKSCPYFLENSKFFRGVYPLWTLALGWLGALFVIPILLIVFVPLRIWKWFVTSVAHVISPQFKGLLTGYDSIFAIDKFYTKPYAANVTFFVVEGDLSVETLKQNFLNLVLKNPNCDKLFQVPESFGGYFFWRQKPIDINKHIRLMRDFQSFDHEDELNEILGSLMTSPLPKDSGLWELQLYPGFRKNYSVIVFRMHHVLGDGYSFNYMVDLMIGAKSKYMVKPQEWSLAKKIELYSAVPILITKLYGEAFTHKDSYTQRKFNDTGLVSITNIPLDTMKLIRRHTKTHFATGGALRRHFLETRDVSELPDFVSIMHSLPRPDHPLTTENSSEDNSGGKMCNHWGVGLFKIPLKTSSPLERLTKAEASFDTYMSDQNDKLIHCHIPLFSLLPARLIKLFFSTNFGTSMGFTSVPAFEKEAHLFGQYRVQNMFKVFGLQWSQSSVAAAIYTHNNQVGYSIFANKDIISDQKTMDRVTREYIHQELQDLVSECGLHSRLRSIRAEGFA